MDPKNPITVTSPLLPPLEEFVPYLEQIWQSKWITNNGHFHQELEKALCEYLGVEYISLFTNGTLPLITALQALRIQGEVITTPYSFVATTHSIWWNGIRPVFVDVDPNTGNIDPDRIEAAITPRTTAIMPVHVYGTPCEVDRIEAIPRKYGLKVIYDAAHAFGVKQNGRSILNAGDISTLSFHATKTYNTVEGGALICHSKEMKQRIDYLKNFGFAGETEVIAPGINSKMDEIRAAYGLLGLKHVDAAIAGSDLIIGGVSSFGVEWYGENILPILDENVPMISVTKGLVALEDGSLISYLDHWQKKLDAIGSKLKLNAIGGPCTSYELVAHDQTEVAFCGKDMQILRMIKSAMATSYYHISLSTDVVGIESAVALKNGYALGIALTIGVNQKNFGLDSELHFNSQAAVFGQSLKEMSRLLDYQGAGTLDNLAVGIGDLYVTVYGGRTRLIGILLGRGLDIDAAKAELNGVTLESLVVAERVARAVKIKAARGDVCIDDFPLLMHIDEILTQKKEVDIPWEAFTFRFSE